MECFNRRGRKERKGNPTRANIGIVLTVYFNQMNLVHTPPEKPSGPPSRDGSVRGIILVLSLLAAGFLALWGLFMAARPQSPPAPAEAVWGTPDQPIRIVAYNILHNQRGINRVVDE